MRGYGGLPRRGRRRQDPSKFEYQHELFVRGREAAMRGIKRKVRACLFKVDGWIDKQLNRQLGSWIEGEVVGRSR